MSRLAIALLLAISVLAFTACSADGGLADPIELSSVSGDLTGLMAPGSGRVGTNVLTVDLNDAVGPMAGATLHVEPWMPAHGHGSPRETTVVDLGEGRYEVTVYFNMTGAWELQCTVGDDEDSFVFDFPVQ